MIQKLIAVIIALFMKKKPVPIVTPHAPPIIVHPEPQIAPVEEVKPEVLLWNTPEHARHSVRVMCDNAGLTVTDKNEVCATIAGESGFDTKITNKNYIKRDTGEKDEQGKPIYKTILSSTDWGICQINDHYHIGKGKSFASVDEVLNFPEKSVAFIIKQYKLGNIDWWIAHRNGSYKKYL